MAVSFKLPSQGAKLDMGVDIWMIFGSSWRIGQSTKHLTTVPLTTLQSDSLNYCPTLEDEDSGEFSDAI